MSAAALPSARRVTWLRRRRALAGIWQDFRRHRPGMLGLIVLSAIAAPLLADADGLKAVNTTDNPAFASPSEFGVLGTDDLGRDVLTQFIWGARISLLVGLAATLIAVLIGSVVGIAAGFFGGKTGGVLMRITEWFLVIPFLPLAIVLAAILGPSIQNIILALHREPHPRAGPDPARTRLCRSQPCPGGLELASDVAPHPAQRGPADSGQHDPHRPRGHPLRGRALLPRPGRPVERVVGQDAR